MSKSGFAYDIHALRGISIVFIVCSHILYADTGAFFSDFISASFFNYTTFFVFISGYLFQHLLYKFDLKKYYKKRLTFVIIPYLVISLPALVLRLWSGPSYMAIHHYPDIVEQSKIVQLGYYLLTGAHLLPLWYIPMIMLFFIAAPLFRWIDQNPRWYWVLIGLGILSWVMFRDNYNINDIPRMAGHFLFLYLLGMWVGRYRSEIDAFLRGVWKYAVVIAWLLLYLITLNADIPYYFQLIFLQRVVSIFFFLIILRGLRSDGKLYNYLSLLADQSFGIYFLHFYIVLVLREINMILFENQYPTSPLWWALTLVITVVISQFVVYIVKKVFNSNSRYLIGS